MSDALKAAARATGVVRQAAADAVRQAFPTIANPASGSTVTGGATLTVTVSTNRPEVGHTVAIRRADATGTPASAGVTFPVVGGVPTSPGTATVTVPAAEAQDTDYILEVTPADPPGGPSHSVIVTVPAA